jgi:hypothetical protein
MGPTASLGPRRISFTFIIDEASGKYSLDHPGFDYYIEEREGEQDNFYAQMHESLHRGISDEIGPISKVDMQRGGGCDPVTRDARREDSRVLDSTERAARAPQRKEPSAVPANLI